MDGLLRAARIPLGIGRFLTLVYGDRFDSAMTERKPAGKSWESWREELIRLAHEEGAFDNLPGAGKPLADLGESYDPDWWVKKLVRRERVSMLPPALELLHKVEAEVERIWKLSDEAEVRERIRALNVEVARANARAAEGPPTRLAPLDADTIVAQWLKVRQEAR
jgi:DnaJ homologue, subfamily C, member 28, conserved domain